MTSNDFNSRINLQAFCEVNGVKGYDFVKMPRFGWFAVNRADGEIRTLIDFIPIDEMVPFCTDLIIEKRQYHDVKIAYNETSVKHLCNDIRIVLAFRQFHAEAVTEYADGQAYTSGKTENVAKMFERNGMGAFADTGVGLVTEKLLNAYRVPLALPRALKGNLIIPTWCSPKHVCSFEYCKIADPLRRTTFFINGEKGWYGKPEKTVYGNFSNLLTHSGCTWDRKLDWWLDKPVNLDESLTVPQCLQIWTEAANARFKRTPLDIIESTNGVGKLRLNLEQLSLSQIRELEKRFSVELGDSWRAQKQSIISIGNFTFIAKDMRYYLQHINGTLQEIANFNMEVNRVVRRGDKFFRQGIISYEGKQEPFELPNELFMHPRKFNQAVQYFFLNRGLGVPVISSIYGAYVLEVVNRINMNVMIDPVG